MTEPGGSLWIVGTGIGAIGQVTLEARSIIENADVVLSLVADPLTATWVQSLNPEVKSLQVHYSPGKERLDTYHQMVDVILDSLRAGRRTCVIFYGHPGVFVYPSHIAITRARSEGYRARMLPAVSAEDCLFADLGFDPATRGCLTFEATSFLIHDIVPDPSVDLILWQVGVIGRTDFRYDYEPRRGLEILSQRLSAFYSERSSVVLYEAAHFPLAEPRIEWVTLEELSDCHASAVTTLYVPHCVESRVNLDMIAALDMTKHVVHADR